MQLPTPSICRHVPPRYPQLGDCDFYHSQILPTGEVIGQWDLRPSPDTYLGHVDFNGRNVLEIGPASGFLSFHMEQAGATVSCLEPSMSHLWDTVPFPGVDADAVRVEFANHIERIRNSFWYCHALHRSQAKLFEADPCNIPSEMGDHDVGVLACVLLHTRSPFSLLESLSRRVTQTMVVVDNYNAALGPEPVCRFMPNPSIRQFDTWWQFSPQFIVSALELLGFSEARVSYHAQKCEHQNAQVPMFTVVASRRQRFDQHPAASA
ncbi:hypothetical protein HZ993_05895 [Rhodoferax sp. AJA081-3]|uniref:hypothetical protein n=1 Tax=Rhodoferax sp. AJA081-3 TaxID=2752316 RepID=UPI001AE0088E|nr:hypothetical protein [Rhodoferax sp. AJA081-3]QTN29356.1 hypothetical protein HZ993_05895 [Rhodoferax sp. AJA081-3]